MHVVECINSGAFMGKQYLTRLYLMCERKNVH